MQRHYTQQQIEAFIKTIIGEALTGEEERLMDELVANGDVVWRPGKSPVDVN